MKSIALIVFLASTLIGSFFVSLSTAVAADLVRKICSERYAQFFASYSPKMHEEVQVKVGIEIEGSVPYKIDLEGIAAHFYDRIKDQQRDVKKNHYFYDDFSRYEVSYLNKNNEEKIYRITRDPSVMSRQAPFEIASPILRDSEDFEVFHDLVQELKKIGGRRETHTGGIHIHIDFSNPAFGEAAAIAAVFSEIEKELMKRFSTVLPRMRHTKTTSKELLQFLRNAKIDDDLTVTDRLWKIISENSREHALNLKSYYRHNTVEFRLFNSTLEFPAIELMHDFASKLVLGIRTQNPALVEYLVNQEGPIEVDRVASILGMKLVHPEAKIVLKKIFMEAKNQRSLKELGVLTLKRLAFQMTVYLTASYVVAKMMESINDVLGDAPVVVK